MHKEDLFYIKAHSVYNKDINFMRTFVHTHFLPNETTYSIQSEL